MTVRVSVVIACYHTKEEYLRQCCDSLILQIFKDWEAIFVVDDYIKGCEWRVINSYNDSRFVIVVNPDKTNPAIARNKGIKWCIGEYVAFLDADDWWDSQKLQKQVEYMDTHKLIDWCWSYAWHVNGDGKKYMLAKQWDNPTATTMIPFQTILIRNEIVSDIKKKYCEVFDSNLPQIDDYDLYLRLKQYTWYRLKEPLSYYRVYTEGKSLNSSKKEILKLQLEINIKRGVWRNVPELIIAYLGA